MGGRLGIRHFAPAVAAALLFVVLITGGALAAPSSSIGVDRGPAGWAPITLRPGCSVSGDVVASANRLMKDRYKLGTRPAVRLPHNPTWRENPFHDDNWLFGYHSLRFVLTLEAAWAKTGARRYLNRALFLARDWFRDNPRSTPRSRFSWDDHATAWRAMVYACTGELVPVSGWLRSALLLHGSVLASPSFYVRHGNHALNQAMGLLEVGRVLHRSDWIKLAGYRINKLIAASVDLTRSRSSGEAV